MIAEFVNNPTSAVVDCPGATLKKGRGNPMVVVKKKV
jgi:hypothetical protein